MASLDNYIGQPFKKTINQLIQFLSGDFQNVHSVSIDAAEEDYLTLLPIGACAILIFAFPQSPALRNLLNFETMNAREKTTISSFIAKTYNDIYTIEEPIGSSSQKTSVSAPGYPISKLISPVQNLF